MYPSLSSSPAGDTQIPSSPPLVIVDPTIRFSRESKGTADIIKSACALAIPQLLNPKENTKQEKLKYDLSPPPVIYTPIIIPRSPRSWSFFSPNSYNINLFSNNNNSNSVSSKEEKGDKKKESRNNLLIGIVGFVVVLTAGFFVGCCLGKHSDAKLNLEDYHTFYLQISDSMNVEESKVMGDVKKLLTIQKTKALYYGITAGGCMTGGALLLTSALLASQVAWIAGVVALTASATGGLLYVGSNLTSSVETRLKTSITNYYQDTKVEL